MNAGTAHVVGSPRADVGGRAVQEVGRSLGLRVEVEELLDGGTQVGVAGTLLVQERAALRRAQVGRLLEQHFDGFGRWLGHVPTVLGLAEPLHAATPGCSASAGRACVPANPRTAAVSSIVKPVK